MGTPLQYSCLENPMDGGAWRAAVHRVAKSRTRQSDLAAAAAGLVSQAVLVVKNPLVNAGASAGSSPGSGRPPGEGNGNPLQYSCLENPMDGGAWRATVHGVTKSQTRLGTYITRAHTHTHTTGHIHTPTRTHRVSFTHNGHSHVEETRWL